jgi:hypothetical protein
MNKICAVIALALVDLVFVASATAETIAVMSYNVRGLPPLVIENREDEIEAIAPLLEDFHTAGGAYEGIDSLVGLQELFYQPYYDTLTDDQMEGLRVWAACGDWRTAHPK